MNDSFLEKNSFSKNNIRKFVKGEEVKSLKAQVVSMEDRINFIDTNKAGPFIPQSKHSFNPNEKIVEGIKYNAEIDIDNVSSLLKEINKTAEIGMNKLANKQLHSRSK